MKRNHSIDVLRVISAIAVIIIHVVVAPVNYTSGPIDPSVESILSIIHSLCYWSVPVFFMITGYCMMLKKECTYQYCFSHAAKFIAVLFTVGLFYALLEEVFSTRTVNLSILLTCVMRVINGRVWDFMWYIYAIIGIYLVMPLLHGFLQKDKGDALILTGLLFIFTILLPAAGDYITIGIDFPIGGYLFYVCMGGIIAKYPPKQTTLWKFLCGGMVAAYCAAVFIGYSFSLIWNPYLDPLVCAASVSLFFLVSNLPVRSSKALHVVASCTWGIYLLHPFFINIFLKLFHLDLLSVLPGVKLPLFGLALFALSLASTYILRKLPLVKYLF